VARSIHRTKQQPTVARTETAAKTNTGGGDRMRDEFRVTIDAPGAQASEEFLNTLKKMADKAEWEHGIDVDVQRVETESVPEASFETGGSDD
jgi:hypothetical protein